MNLIKISICFLLQDPSNDILNKFIMVTSHDITEKFAIFAIKFTTKFM